MLKKKPPHESTDVLERDLSSLLASNLQLLSPPPLMENRIRLRLIDRVSGQQQFFIFANQSDWKTVGPGLQIKLLHKSKKTKSYLLQMAKQSVLPSHRHQADEEAFVIDGEVWLDGVFCTQGDYHFSAAGTSHRHVFTEKGCTLLMKITTTH